MKKLKTTRVKPKVVWAVIHSNGDISVMTCSYYRKYAIERMTTTYKKTWAKLRQLGYRVARVVISEQRKKAK